MLLALASCSWHAVSSEEIADERQAAILWGYEPDFNLHAVIQRVSNGRLGFSRMASADLKKCLALLSPSQPAPLP